MPETSRKTKLVAFRMPVTLHKKYLKIPRGKRSAFICEAVSKSLSPSIVSVRVSDEQIRASIREAVRIMKTPSGFLR